MVICPDCQNQIVFDKYCCNKCGWVAEVNHDITNFLSSSDKNNSIFRQYIDLYESIAASELASPVNSDSYVISMAKKTASLLGDINGKTICDVGSGKGFLLREIISKNPEKVTAVDISSQYLSKIKLPNVQKVIANAENLPFFDEFDIVCSTDVMEHVLNLGSFMFCVNRMLKDDGLFVVRVPYRENLLQYGRQTGTPYPFTHVRTYNLSLLKDQLKDSGFDTVKVTYDGFQPAYPRSFFRNGIGKSIFKKIVNDRYPDYWTVTEISEVLGVMFMKPIEVNVLARKVKHLERS